MVLYLRKSGNSGMFIKFYNLRIYILPFVKGVLR